jgi:anti-sigma B factor antagonist
MTASRESIFSVARTEDQGTVTLSLSGELDLSSRDELIEATKEIPAGARLVVDLAEVTFMDSSGLVVLMNLDLRSRAEGWTARLANPQPPVRRLFELCGFEQRLPIDG